MNKKVLLLTLGCAKNEVDTDMLGGILQEHGCKLVNNSDKADIILINTCGFIESAKQESIDTILQATELKRERKDLKVYVWGCLWERYKQKLEDQIPEVDGFWGIEPFREMGNFFIGRHFNFSPQYWQTRIISNYSHTAYIKIADGCDHNCTFCIIPAIKGTFRSRPSDDIKAEAQMLADRGVKEIHLVAQDSTVYGKDLFREQDLITLLKNLVTIDGLEWIRILYTYPDSISEKLIDLMAVEPKICNYLDIPLQHISRSILKAMKRNSSKNKIINTLKRFRTRIPDIILRTSFMVGFPGETEENFQELLDFIQEVKFNRVGCFIFSPEEGTPAYNYEDQVEKEIAVRRFNQLMDMQQNISYNINKTYLNKTIKVLIDGYDTDYHKFYGRTEGDSLEIDQSVWVRGKAEIGEFCNVRIDHYSAYDLEGKKILTDE